MGTLKQAVDSVVAATSAIGTAIAAKGGTVAAGDGLEDFAAAIGTIPTGSYDDIGALLNVYGLTVTQPYSEQSIIDGISNDILMSGSLVYGINTDGSSLTLQTLTENVDMYIPLQWYPYHISANSIVSRLKPIRVSDARALDIYLKDMMYYYYPDSNNNYTLDIDFQLVAINESVPTENPETVIELNNTHTISPTIYSSQYGGSYQRITLTNKVQWADIDRQYDNMNLALRCKRYNTSYWGTGRQIAAAFYESIGSQRYYSHFARNS